MTIRYNSWTIKGCISIFHNLSATLIWYDIIRYISSTKLLDKKNFLEKRIDQNVIVVDQYFWIDLFLWQKCILGYFVDKLFHASFLWFISTKLISESLSRDHDMSSTSFIYPFFERGESITQTHILSKKIYNFRQYKEELKIFVADR